MGKQERAEKAQRKARKMADDIIAQAIANIQAKKLAPAAPEAEQWAASAEQADDPEWQAAASVRHLREAGESWWRIGQLLSLPGAGDSAATGKGGAGQARRLYALHFGDVPRVQRARTAAPAERNADRAVIKKARLTDRQAAVREGRGFLRPDMTNAEVVALLRGRKIEWLMNLHHLDGNGDHFVEDEGYVHRIYLRVQEYAGNRCIVFVDEKTRQSRTVRLDMIHTVR